MVVGVVWVPEQSLSCVLAMDWIHSFTSVVTFANTSGSLLKLLIPTPVYLQDVRVTTVTRMDCVRINAIISKALDTYTFHFL